MSARVLWLLTALAPLCLPTTARAHPLSPAALAIRELGPARYDVSFRRSALVSERLVLAWPGGCSEGARRTSVQGDQRVERFELRCARGLEGQSVRVLGLVELGLSAIVHIESQADSVQALLSPARPSFTVPKRSTRWEVLGAYVRLGVEHLASGLDHVLFVLGLLLLVPGARAKLAALTAFTLGHSVTLCLSALGLFALPEPPVEIGIAASLIVLALELLERAPRAQSDPARSWRRAALMAFAFGLLHGLGFAGALVEAGLPPAHVPLSLFGFNLGVELGQLAVVLATAPLALWAKRLPAQVAARARFIAAYGIGSLAALWCIERTLTAFSS